MLHAHDVLNSQISVLQYILKHPDLQHLAS